MSIRWERFTERARRSIILAQFEAEHLGHHSVGTGHILLGIIFEGQSPAANVLATFGLNVANVRREVEAIASRGAHTATPELRFSASAERAVLNVAEKAVKFDHIADPAHLFLGHLSDVEGVAVRVLTNLHVDTTEVRRQMMSLIQNET